MVEFKYAIFDKVPPYFRQEFVTKIAVILNIGIIIIDKVSAYLFYK